MKLTRLKVKNFRQFWGEVDLEFSKDAEKNISVIHGANGSGKTTLLNAFTWALYKDFTPAFENPEDLLSRKAAANIRDGESIELKVEVEFDHQDTSYTAERSLTFAKQGGIVSKQGGDQFAVFIRGEEGKTRLANDPVRLINKILPKYLYSYFFFDGERMKRISKQDRDQRKDIALAIKSLMGVEVLDRAISHVGGSRGIRGVIKHLEDELEQLGDPELDRFLSHKRDLEGQNNQCQDNIDRLSAEVDSIEALINSIDEKLKTIQPAAEKQREREKLQNSLKNEQESLTTVRTELRRIIKTKGYLQFLLRASDLANSIIDNLSEKGQLPSGYKQSFIQGIMERGVCICNTKIESGSPEEKSLAYYKDSGGMADVEEKALYLRGFLGDYKSRKGEFIEDLQDSLDRQSAIRKRIDKIEEELNEIHKSLQGIDVEDVKGLENRRKGYIANKAEKNRELGGQLQRLSTLADQIEIVDKKIRDQSTHEERVQKAQDRLKSAQDSLRIIKEVRELLSIEVVDLLQKEISEIFGQISYKAQTPVLTKDYSLFLVESVGGQELRVGASEGENQALSLSFIGAVVKCAAEKKASKDKWDEVGELPIVMDSPFGTLDENYIEPISKHIPRMAPQVLLLASKKQWSGVAEKTMTPRIGKQYIMRFHTKRKDANQHSITINGTQYDYVIESTDNEEWTEVIEI